MDSHSLLSIFKVLFIVIGAVAIVVGIVRFISSKKKGKGLFIRIGRLVGTFILAVFCFAAPAVLDSGMAQNGEYVKENHPSSIDFITYGQVFDAVCKNMEWSQISREYSTGDNSFIQLDADCNYGGEDRKITIQFDYGIKDLQVINKSTPFCISFVGFDDEENTSTDIMKELIFSMFQNYADEHHLALDESMKDGILYTDGWHGAETEEQESDGFQADSSQEADEDSPQLDGTKTDEEDVHGTEKESEVPSEEESEMPPEEETTAPSADLSYPIMYRGYADDSSLCPVMVNDETSEEIKCGTYEEMMASLVDDGITMYATPIMDGKVIYTATRWQAPESEWYNGLLTYEQFLDMISFMSCIYEENGTEYFACGGSWDDVGALSGRWSGGGQEISISIYSDSSYYYVYDEIGTISVGGQDGRAYLVGKGSDAVYVLCSIDGGGEWMIRYYDDGEFVIWRADEGSPVTSGTQFECVESFMS